MTDKRHIARATSCMRDIARDIPPRGTACSARHSSLNVTPRVDSGIPAEAFISFLVCFFELVLSSSLAAVERMLQLPADDAAQASCRCRASRKGRRKGDEMFIFRLARDEVKKSRMQSGRTLRAAQREC